MTLVSTIASCREAWLSARSLYIGVTDTLKQPSGAVCIYRRAFCGGAGLAAGLLTLAALEFAAPRATSAQSLSSDTTLSAFTVTDGEHNHLLDRPFSPSIRSYRISRGVTHVPLPVTSFIDVAATVNDNGATLTSMRLSWPDGTVDLRSDVSSGAAVRFEEHRQYIYIPWGSDFLDEGLAFWTTILEVTVTAQDGTQDVYSVSILPIFVPVADDDKCGGPGIPGEIRVPIPGGGCGYLSMFPSIPRRG